MPATGKITVDPVRAAAFDELYRYYSDVFSRGRNEYAIQPNALSDPAKAAANERVLLVDGLGRFHRPSRHAT